MEFQYLAIDQKGTKQKGIIEANNQKEVLDFLRSSKLTPINIKSGEKNALSGVLFFKKIGDSDIVLFTRQLSSMIIAGLTLIESLEVLKKQADKASMQNLINDLISDVSEGNSFSHALSNHKEVFSELYISLIRAAETGGLLDKVLERLASNLEKSENLKKNIRSALFYPAIIIVGVVIVIVIMNVVVMPQLRNLYESLNVELPFITQVVLGVSRIFTAFFPILIFLPFILFFLYKRFQKTDLGVRTIDKFKLKIPILGGIITLSILDEISRTLSLLITSGSSIIDSLNVTSKIANNIWYKEAIQNAATLVEKGISVSAAFEHQNIFPPVLIQMTKVGEATGTVNETLYKVSGYFERDLDLKIKTLTTSIEPLLIVVLGGIVAFLILAVITPIYGLISQIQ